MSLVTDDVAVIRRNGLTVPHGFTTRSQLPARLSELITGQATTVVLVEPDGARHTDTLTPPDPSAAPEPSAGSVPRILGGGFVPGEEVQVFQLVGATRADPDGRADSGGHHGAGLLFGAISGTAVRHADHV